MYYTCKIGRSSPIPYFSIKGSQGGNLLQHVPKIIFGQVGSYQLYTINEKHEFHIFVQNLMKHSLENRLFSTLPRAMYSYTRTRYSSSQQ